MVLLFSCVEDQDLYQFTSDGSIAAIDVQEAIQVVRDEAGSGDYEILVSSGVDSDVQAALDIAGTTPVRITADIIDLDRPILMDSDQTLIFEDQTIYVRTGATMDGGDPFTYFNGHGVIKNRNGAGHGDQAGGDWGGTGFGGETNITVIGGTIDGTGQVTYEYNGVQLHDVTNSRIENVKFKNVMPDPRTGKPQGNVDLRDCDYILVKNIESLNAKKSGIYIENFDAGNVTDGTEIGHITIDGGYIYNSGDSGIIGINSYYGVVQNVHVDACGTDNNSNITMNMRWGKFINNKSTNAPGTTNGYGFTLGHPAPYSAWNTVVSGNTFEGNAFRGIFLQGASTEGNVITDNIIINNGVGHAAINAGGIYSNGNLANIFSYNTIRGNKNGIVVGSGTVGAVIKNNDIQDNKQFGVYVANGVGTRIEDNYFKGQPVVTGADIYDFGTGTFLAGNEHSDGGE